MVDDTDWGKIIKEHNRTKHREYMKKYNKSPKAKVSAHREDRRKRHIVRSVTNNAIRAGTLVKPTVCPRCGATDRPIEAHHKHYNRPDSHLDVDFMCEPCHEKEHST